jgi:hypothetical protein
MSTRIVASKIWRTVTGAAGYRCQCVGACGDPHRMHEGRCPARHGRGGPRGPLVLHVAPADLTVSGVAAAALPASELRAWCPPCLTAAQHATDRRARGSEPTAADALF